MFLFRNDYSHGAHPKVLAALSATNLEGNPGYGEDMYCARAAGQIRALCQAPNAEVQFFIGGTQANFTAICAFLRPWEAVITAETGHVNGHEGGAVEATGHKLINVPTEKDGKLQPCHILSVLKAFDNPHVVKPRLVYISNATENGAIYSLKELEDLAACCEEYGLLLFMDGARLGAALAAPGNDVTLKDLARLTDAFYIGGTKNGALMGEALVICNPTLQPDFFTVKKQRGGVLAKGWLLGAQFEALLQDNLYFELARHADEMAARLQDGLKTLGIPLYVQSPTNQIFPIVSNQLKAVLDEACYYEDWCPASEEGHTVIRFVTCFATTEAEVDGLLALLRDHLNQ